MTSFHELPDGAKLAYDDKGSGRDVLLIHGMCMTRRYFDRNFDALAERFRVVRVDLRSHGDSPASEGNNTVAQYAKDVKHLVDTMGLDKPVLAGWSMGTLTIWELIRQFGSDWMGGHVNISQGPSDLVRDDFPIGAFTMDDLHGLLAGAQADFRGTMEHLIPLMVKHKPNEADMAFLLDEVCKIGPNCGTLCILDQSVQDYRDVVRQLRAADVADVGRRRAAHLRRRRRVAEGAPEGRRDGDLRGVRPLPDVGGAREVQPGRRRLDRRSLTSHSSAGRCRTPSAGRPACSTS